MYKTHPLITFPANESSHVWRYLDFTKFVDLLETRSLYFARADHLGDPFEYAIPEATLREAKVVAPTLPQLMLRCSQVLQKTMFVNCWHMNEYESAAMWRLYLKSDEGIAIRSTARRLADCFAGYGEDVFIGQVSYIDYDVDGIEFNCTFNNIFSKRISFAHEKEVRAVVWQCEGAAEGLKPSEEHGLIVPVDLPCLVEAVYVAPTTAAWFHKLVGHVLQRYGLSVEVRQSSLSKSPISELK